MSKGMKKLLSLALSFMMCLSIVTLPSTAMATEAPGTGPIVIWELFAGGGSASGIYHQRYIVLKNTGSDAADIGGYALWKASASGSFSTTYFYQIPASTTLNAGAYCFIPLKGADPIQRPLPEFTPSDTLVVLPASNSIDCGTSGAKVAITSDGVAPTSPAASNVVDFLGYGNANASLGTVLSISGKSLTTQSIQRQAWTGNNNADYEIKDVNLTYLTGSVPATECATPTANPSPGTVNVGTTVTLSTTTSGASIYYTTDGNEPVAGTSALYSTPFALPGSAGTSVTVKALASKDGLTNSGVATFTYTLYEANAVKTVQEVLALNIGTECTVQGQIVYFATTTPTYANPVLQQKTPDGKIYSLYVYGSAPQGAKIGDIVNFSGTYTVYNGLP